MVTEYNRNILLKRRQAELERKANVTSSAEAQIENETKTAAESAVTETDENEATAEKQEQPVKKTDAEKLSRRKKQG